jgi:hypothetical protein
VFQRKILRWFSNNHSNPESVISGALDNAGEETVNIFDETELSEKRPITFKVHRAKCYKTYFCVIYSFEYYGRVHVYILKTSVASMIFAGTA